ncbi:MAG: hypothetical protein QOK47_911, partial [Actinomycetota bacterium]|nr:hypothetical protein [Actinomycetota bacterium]
RFRAKSERDTGSTTLIAFALFYIAAVVVARSVTGYSPLDSRLLSPTYIPLVLVAVAAFDRMIDPTDEAKSRFVRLVLGGAGLVLLGASVVALARQVDSLRTDGVPGATSRDFRQLAIVPAACDEAEGYDVLLGNSPEPFSFWCERAFDYGPLKSGEPRSYDRDDLESLKELLASQGTALYVWMGSVEDPTQYVPAELERVFDFKIVSRFPEGNIYELSP